MLRPLAAGVLCAVVALFVPPAAEAQDEADTGDEGGSGLTGEAPAPGEQRVAVLILAAGGVDAETADSLTELAIGSVAERGGARIVGKEEFQAQLGQGEARSIECVSSAACLGRVGVELGVDEVIAGTVARRGETWVFNLNRIDIRSGELAGRAFREVPGGLGELADAIGVAIPALYEVPHELSALLVSASVEGAEVIVDGALVGVYRGEPVRIPDLSAGRHEVSVSAPGYLDWSRTANLTEGATLQLDATLEEPRLGEEPYVSPLLYIGAGAAVLGTAGAIFFGLSSRRATGDRDNRAEAVEFVDARERDALFANIGFGVAAAGVVTAVIGLLLSDFDGEPAAGVAAAPLRGGALLEAGGRF